MEKLRAASVRFARGACYDVYSYREKRFVRGSALRDRIASQEKKRFGKQLAAGERHLFSECVLRLGGKPLGVGVRNGNGQKMGWFGGAATCILLSAVFLAGCQNYNVPITQVPGGGSGGGSTGLFITLIPGGTVFIDAGKTRVLTAALTNDPSNQGVTWVLTGQGTLSNLTNTSATFTAVSGVGTSSVVQATSVSDPSQVAQATMLVVPDPSISTTTVANAALGTPYASVINVSNGSSPFNWSVASGTLPPGLSLTVGSISSVTLTGTPTVLGTYTFKLQSLDVCSVASQQSYTMTVGPATSSASALMGGGVNNAMLQGQYAFRFSGFGPHGFTAEAGSFTADGKGNITGGVLDRNGAAGPQSKMTFGGTYGVGSNQLGAMSVQFADGTSNTFALAVNSTGDARFIEFDDTTGGGTRGSGEMRKRQLNTGGGGAALAGNPAGDYVLELTGTDASGARLAMAGQFTSNDSGAVVNSELDANDAGTMATRIPFSGGANIASDGSGSASWNVPGFGMLHLSLYAVSADEVFAVGMDAAAPGVPVLAGSVMRQSGGPFTSTSLNGSAVIQMTGFNSGLTKGGGQATGTVGVLRFDGTGGAQEFALQSGHGATPDLNTSFVMSASAEGRVVLGSAGDGIVYLASPRRGFVLGTDGNVEAGTIESQTGSLAAGFNGILVGANSGQFSTGLSESIFSISFGGNGAGTLVEAVSDSTGLAVNVAAPGGVLYKTTNGIVEFFNPAPQPDGDGLIGLMFVVSPGKAIYLQMGPLAAAPVLIQNLL
jgi:hypothetical protein